MGPRVPVQQETGAAVVHISLVQRHKPFQMHLFQWEIINAFDGKIADDAVRYKRWRYEWFSVPCYKDGGVMVIRVGVGFFVLPMLPVTKVPQCAGCILADRKANLRIKAKEKSLQVPFRAPKSDWELERGAQTTQPLRTAIINGQ
jgi:hypothetical protein